MNKDQIKGRAEEVSGKAKAAVGKVLKDGELVNKGRLEEVAFDDCNRGSGEDHAAQDEALLQSQRSVEPNVSALEDAEELNRKRLSSWNAQASCVKPGLGHVSAPGRDTRQKAYHHGRRVAARRRLECLRSDNDADPKDDGHPGVAITRAQGNFCLAGAIDVINPNYEPEFPDYRNSPARTREMFEKKGWSTIVAFQTRNPIHRSHEYLTKVALEQTDGLMIHPLVGETKKDDIPAQTRMDCYKTLVDNYYNKDRTILSVMPLAMRYAGPREAILHALIRKNYGCTHFIVGRDHAGVGNYYGTYDAQKIFDQFDVPKEIGMTILKFEHTAWCKKCEAVVSSKTCPHGPEDKVAPSGTKVRDMLKAGERPPNEFSRPEVADILIKWAQAAG